ncbi:MAG: hypothetical protein WCB19_03220 [Thermoplasmata archaeon]
MNRSALRGYVWIAAVGLIVLAAFALPDLAWFAGLLSAGFLLIVVGVWMQFSLHAGDQDGNDAEETEDGREPLTGERD